MDRINSGIEHQPDQRSDKTPQDGRKSTKTEPSRRREHKETYSPILAPSSKPWLNRDDQPKSPAELREVVKDWKSDDWERYLASLETPQKEELLGRGEAVEWLSADAHTAALVETETVQSAPYPHLSTKVANLLASLSERQRVIVRMRYWENKTLQEIAATLGIRYQSVQDFLKSSHRKIFLRLRIIQAKQQLSILLNSEQSCEVTREEMHVL